MCDNHECNWVWTVRDRATGKPITTSDGYIYYFTEETEARALVETTGRTDLEPTMTREPGV